MMLLVLPVFLLTITVVIEAQFFHRWRGPPFDDPPSNTSVRIPTEKWALTRLDHYTSSDLRTWWMRYLMNNQHYQTGGPIFIWLGGEAPIVEGHLRTGQIYEMAYEHRGIMFSLEHRFYGKSYPLQDFSTPNLQYLSVHQALGDVISFIAHIKRIMPVLQYSKVVVVGCSYPASMATWLRLKYPQHIDAVYAASGPVKAVADFPEFLEVVSNNIAQVSQQCARTISEGMSQLEAKLETFNGITEMSWRLNTCQRIPTSIPHRTHFFNRIIMPLEGIGLDGIPNCRSMCAQIAGYPGSSLDKLVRYIRTTYGTYCIDGYDDFIRTLSSIQNTPVETRPWLYQVCTEFGYLQTTNSQHQVFGHTVGLEYMTGACRDLFGASFGLERMAYGINRTNAIYGSLTPNVTKVVSIHGTADPWHKLGILEDLNPLAPAIVINGAIHCEVLKSNTVYDTPEMIAARRRARQFIAEWIK